MYIRRNRARWFRWYNETGIRGYGPMERCWEELAQAIILSAVAEYRKALKYLRINPRNREWNRRKDECEQFFRSWWFGILTDADPATIIEKLRKEAAG